MAQELPSSSFSIEGDSLTRLTPDWKVTLRINLLLFGRLDTQIYFGHDC